jgi:hypothetical protein
MTFSVQIGSTDNRGPRKILKLYQCLVLSGHQLIKPGREEDVEVKV